MVLRAVVWIIVTALVCLSLGQYCQAEVGASASLDHSADKIIALVENNLNGQTMQMDVTMVVETPRFKRTMKMRSYSQGKKRSFIQILYPGKDRGITFLKVDNAMWQYVPRIEKIIKIPASMMLQSWMGSDFTNDDLVRESSISEDYKKRLLNETAYEYTIELIPKQDAAVVWGKIVMRIDKEYYLPTEVDYFDESGTLIRRLSYTDVRAFGAHHYPTRWVMVPQEESKVGHKTIVEITDLAIDEKISEEYFTKRALKQFSR